MIETMSGTVCLRTACMPKPELVRAASSDVLACLRRRRGFHTIRRLNAAPPPISRQSLPNKKGFSAADARIADQQYAKSLSMLSGAYWDEHMRLAKKNHPVLLRISILVAAASLGVVGLLFYDEFTNVKPEFKAYPDAVEHRLRKALIAIHRLPDPDESQKQFLLALQSAEAEGMDPYSNEVLGIRTRLAAMQEHFGRAREAIATLQETIRMCEQRIEAIDHDQVDGSPEHLASRKAAMLATVIRCRVKVANIYEGDYLQDQTSAKKALSDAVGLLVGGMKDAQTAGLTDDNAAKLPVEEIASMMSQMGDLYATTGEEANAAQTYMLALQPLRLACNGTRSCKEVQVLSNIASSMDLAMKKPGATINGRPADKNSLAAARQAILKWADQAIATAEVVKPEDRDQLCELGLLSAEMTKADLLLEDGQLIRAREALRSLLPRLREKGLDSLVVTAEQLLKRAGD